MKTSRAKSLVAIVAIAALATGCSEPKEPTRINAEVPSGVKERDAWAAKAADDNGVKGDTSAPAVARILCSDVLPKHDNLTEAALELGKWQSVRAWDTSELMAIAIYGYCPQYKPLWEENRAYKSTKVIGVTQVLDY